MVKVILFDLYDTILKDISFDFNNGLTYLHKTFFSKACSIKELMDFSETFLPLYDKRKTDNTEICLIGDEIPQFFIRYGIPLPEDLASVEYAVMNQMQKVTLMDSVRDTLQMLYDRGVLMYILSNSIFTGNAAKKLLNDFGIAEYFKKLYSSADYGIRKPDRRFFDIAVNGILSDNCDVKKEEILYVGNDYVTDVTGAAISGLKTVWYNVKRLPNEKSLCIWDIDNFRKILDIV